MDVTLLTWALVVGAILALIVVDLLTVSRKPHDVMFKEAAIGRFSTSVLRSLLVCGFGKPLVHNLEPNTLQRT